MPAVSAAGLLGLMLPASEGPAAAAADDDDDVAESELVVGEGTIASSCLSDALASCCYNTKCNTQAQV
jgi:hypothetical protein